MCVDCGEGLLSQLKKVQKHEMVTKYQVKEVICKQIIKILHTALVHCKVHSYHAQ